MTADTVGGVWQYALSLAHGLTASDVEVVIAAMGGRATEGQRRDARAIDGLQLFDSEYRLEWMADPWTDIRDAGEWLLDLASGTRPDVVHLNNFAHGALRWNAPVLMVGHSCVFSWFRAVEHCDPPEEWSCYRQEVARGLAAADAVTAPSFAMLRALQEHYGSFRHIAPIHNGAVPTDFHIAQKEPFVFGAGRLWDSAKNLALLDAVADDLPWPVYVAGSARHPDGGDATFRAAQTLGLLDRSELSGWLGRASIYALPACYEPFGLSALEAALSGCALVLGDIPSLREIWSDAAIYVDPLDASSLREAVAGLIEDAPRRKAQADRARLRARRYSVDRMVAGYLAAYRDITTRTRHVPIDIPLRRPKATLQHAAVHMAEPDTEAGNGPTPTP